MYITTSLRKMPQTKLDEMQWHHSFQVLSNIVQQILVDQLRIHHSLSRRPCFLLLSFQHHKLYVQTQSSIYQDTRLQNRVVVGLDAPRTSNGSQWFQELDRNMLHGRKDCLRNHFLIFLKQKLFIVLMV